MDKRKFGLFAVLVMLAGAYVWVIGTRREAPLQVQFVELPGSSPTFSFNDDVVIRELVVVRKGQEPAEGEVYSAPEDEVVWHLVPRPPRNRGQAQEGEPPRELREQPATRAVAYGRRVRGLRRAPGTPRRGVPLEAGATYHFTATLDDGQVELEFSPGGSAGS
ncbi:MAG: hypothetical protein AAF800_04930 [Planctomycetota bacterium]